MRAHKTAAARTLGAFAACLGLVLLPWVTIRSLRASAARDGNSGYVTTETREGRLVVFDDVWQTINEHYYDPSFAGLDWDAQRAAFRQAAAEARGSREIYEVLRRMVGSLNDVHTRVYSPEEKFDWWQPRFVTVGLTIREIEGVPTVVQVDSNSPANRTGIRPGDVIEAVDGVAAQSVIQQHLSDQPLLTTGRSSRFRAVATLMEGPADSMVRITWRGKNGKTKFAALQRQWFQRQLGFHFSHNRSNYLVVEIDAFTQQIVVELIRSLKKELRGAQGIVLDLRSNGGGDADAMAEIASAFLGDGISLGHFTDRAGTDFQLSTSSKSPLSALPISFTTLSLVVLTSERTSSAAEILAAALQARGRARVLGTDTCGCVLAIRSRHTLPDGGVLDVSEFDYRTASGVRLEGNGVKADEVIRPERRDLYSDRDRTLESALMILKRSNSALR